MKISHAIATQVEGDIIELMEFNPATLDKVPTLEEVLACMGKMAFMLETVAHLQGREATMLPTCEEARKIIAALN